MLCDSAIFTRPITNNSRLESLAGAEGLEPPKAVLETAGLPLAYAPAIVATGQQPSVTLGVTLAARLLNLLVRMVLTAEGAEFLHLQPFRRRLFVLHAGVVFTLTLGALKRDIFARHFT
jgi:hypothetical protein